MNVIGAEIYTHVVNSTEVEELKIQLNSLALKPGAYFLEIISGDNIGVARFMKMDSPGRFVWIVVPGSRP